MNRHATRFAAAALALLAAAGTSAQAPRELSAAEMNEWVLSFPADTPLDMIRETPQWLGDVSLPEQFTLIGAVTRSPRDVPGMPGGMSAETSVAFRSDMPASAARDALLAALAEGGWLRENLPSEPEVFLVGEPQRFDMVCRDGDRLVARVVHIEGTSYAVLRRPAVSAQESRAPACGAITSPPSVFPAGLDALRKASPSLSLPDTREAPGNTPNNSGSNDSVTYATTVISPDGPAALARLLATQLQQQQWTQDASWSGAGSAGSAWRRTLANGKPVWGLLELTDLGEDRIDVRLNLIAIPEPQVMPTLGDRWVVR